MQGESPRAPTRPGSQSWLEPWTLSRLHELQRSIGEMIGVVRSQHEGTNRRIDDLREEMVGRFERLEAEARRPPQPAPPPAPPSPPPSAAAAASAMPPLRAKLLELAKGLPWTHIATLTALGILGLLGHVSPADIRKYLLGG
jgi:hypothetical protein